jgi:3-hydroxyacyl-[acyl-carrier-protein] dehydratase
VNKEEIMKILPHREDMLLVEEAYLDGETAHGKYTVRGDEFFLHGHFPGNPVVPGVILCEMMAQSACVLLASGQADGCTPYFTSLNNVKFKNPVKPGDVFETKCSITKVKKPFYFCSGEGYVDGKLCVKGDFSFALMKG